MQAQVLVAEELHILYLAGDPTAGARICELLLKPVLSILISKNERQNDPHIIETAVNDAFMGYLRAPEKYKPALGSLLSYMVMSAQGDLRNAMSASRRWLDNTTPLEPDVAEGVDGSEPDFRPDPGVNVEQTVIESMSGIWQKIDALLTDPSDRIVIRMIVDGVRETHLYAEQLGILNLSQAEQEREVKRVKDRIRKKVRRNLGVEEFRNDD